MRLKKHFLTGLVILLPVVLTIAFFSFLINLLTAPFIDLTAALLKTLSVGESGFLFLSPEQVVHYTAKLLLLVLFLVGTVGLGILARLLLLDALVHWGDLLLQKIPFLNMIYTTLRDLFRTLLAPGEKALRTVVLVPFPHPGVFALGFVARKAPAACGEELISVFIPSAPVPTNGFVLLCKEKDLRPVPIHPEEAFKYIISCGVIEPHGKTS